MTPRGFRFAAAEAAVKKPGRLDLGLLLSASEAAVAGVFTRNRVTAAPVLLCRERVGRGVARAVLVNSGNANACTGAQGLEDARRLTASLAERLGVEADAVFPCSTGVIGLPLPVVRMEAALPRLVSALGDDPEPFARAMMTTDSFPKVSTRSVSAGGREVRVLGTAKGAGMIRPDVATMLAFLVTDAPLGSAALQELLAGAAEETFNRITVDGDTSTNDTVLALAGGAAGGPPLETNRSALEVLAGAFREVCRDLSRMMVRDGEGATKVVDVRVRGAASDAAALQAARTVAESPLVKTALHGEDPNWGRIAAALGRSGAYGGGAFSIAIGGVPVVEAGMGLGAEAEAGAHAKMQGTEYEICVTLQEGSGEAVVTTCDLTAEYVRINADYRT
ncbi:MAG: bifunctional glutamate N-acetyltransferase/amino-acid acetyltransferase ArgJ [Deferrisomatales bacterium]